MGAILEKLVVPMPDIRMLAAAEARTVLALRLVIAAQKANMDCRPQLADRLGGENAATKMLIAMESSGHAWPEPFLIGRPCCPRTTPDEYLFLQLLRRAAMNDRMAFDWLLREMIGDCERHRIYLDLESLASVRCQ